MVPLSLAQMETPPVQISIDTVRGVQPFWTPALTTVSDRLWLPTMTAPAASPSPCLSAGQPHEVPSWFSPLKQKASTKTRTCRHRRAGEPQPLHRRAGEPQPLHHSRIWLRAQQKTKARSAHPQQKTKKMWSVHPPKDKKPTNPQPNLQTKTNRPPMT